VRACITSTWTSEIAKGCEALRPAAQVRLFPKGPTAPWTGQRRVDPQPAASEARYSCTGYSLQILSLFLPVGMMISPSR